MLIAIAVVALLTAVLVRAVETAPQSGTPGPDWFTPACYAIASACFGLTAWLALG